MNCKARADRLEFTLLDQGAPPDPARIAAQPPNDSALSGRGTHLIQMIMDEVSYERVALGNQLRLSKQLPVERVT
jgi:anti-sigma regulatory factor (Ser/Thr protein kinase)